MNLAEIFLASSFCIASTGPLLAARHEGAPTPISWNESIRAEGVQDQAAPSPAQAPSNTSQPPSGAAASASSSSQNPPATKKRRRRKKKVHASDCNSAPASPGQAASDSVPSSAAASNAGATTASAPTNCPPSKVIVRQGGTAEPSIQLAGGAASASQQRDTANKMLGTTEANLKKIEGRQLTSNQQNMINQIRQFMEQSKAAVGDGDLDRARTLAWKAQVLSEELVKPAK